MLQARLLGQFDLRLDGQTVEFSSRTAPILFIYLLLNPDKPQRREKLAGLLWPDATESNARSNLRSALWRLRKALQEGGSGDHKYLRAGDESIVLSLQPGDWLDVAILEAKTGAETPTGELVEMVAVYGGELLPGFYEDWVVLERERLQAAFERKMGMLLERLLAERRWEDVLEWGERWIAQGNTPEPAYRALMLAHAGLGDLTGAVDAYRRCVAVLGRELGVEPSEQTRKVYEQIQAGRVEFPLASSDLQYVSRNKSSEAASWPASGLPRSNVPAPLTSLIGREREVTAVRAYLAGAGIRLVTLIGPPGIGKTRLSLEVARETIHDFPGGVFFVALAALDDPDLIAPTIVQTFEFVEIKGRSHIESLKDGIGDKHMLLVLDNIEHLIESAAPLVSELLSACPGLKILTTSREALRVPGEWLYPVPALDFPEESQLPSADIEAISQFPALALFTERARAVWPGFALNADNIESVAAICTQLDGLPLAIELVAARIHLMSPQLLLSRLSDGLTLRAGGIRALPARQQTLHHAIGWSYNLLSGEEQELFACLSVFSGGFTLQAAETIFSQAFTHGSVTDIIASLLDKSLLQRTFDAQGEPRFNLLVTIQQYAAERLREGGEEMAARDRHQAYFLDLAEKADRENHGPDQVEWIERQEMEHDNFRAALEWCVSKQNTEAALRLLGALVWTWGLRGYYSEVLSWFDKIRELPEVTAHPVAYARLLNHLGSRSWLWGDFVFARSVLEAGRAIWLKLGAGGERGLAEALNFLGWVVLSSEYDYTSAQSFMEQSLELYQKHGDQRGMAFAIISLGWIATDRNQDAASLSFSEQSLDLYRQVGDLWGIGRSSQLLGQLYLKLGNYGKARLFFEQHLSIEERLHFKQGTVMALVNLGNLCRYQGDYDQAEQFYQKSLAMCLEYVIKWKQTYVLFFLGLLALHRNDFLLAKQYFIEYFDLARGFNDNGCICDLFTGLAAVAGGKHQPERAAKLSGAAQAIVDTIDYQFPPFDRAEFDRHIRIAREQIGEAAFEAFAEEGKQMPLEQAVAYALEICEVPKE